MTISTDGNRIEYTGNGVTTAFSYPYKFLANSDLVVIETVIATGVSTTKTLNTDYTVSGAGDAGGGTVTAVTAPAGAVTWAIYGDPAITQSTDLTDNSKLPADSLEDMVDRLTLIAQRTRNMANRSLRLPEGDIGFTTSDVELPPKANRAGLYVAFDADGKPACSSGTGADSGLRADLAASGGAALISFSQAGAGAAAVNAQWVLRGWIELEEFGAVGDLITDDSAAILAAYTAAAANGINEIKGRSTTGYLCSNKIFAGVQCPVGIKLIASGKRNGLAAHDGVVIKYTGTGYCFDFRNAHGAGTEYGALEFEGFTFWCSNNDGGMFSLNYYDVITGLTYTPTDSSATNAFIRAVKFSACKFWGAAGGAAQTGHAIQAVKTFEIVTDDECEFHGWLRAIYLKGCDNCRIDGRMYSNGRNVQVEASGTFGNNNSIHSNWMGPTAVMSEDSYLIYDAASKTTMYGTVLEGGTTETALLYLGGIQGRLISPAFQSATIPPFDLGADAVDYVLVAPSASVIVPAPIISAAASVDAGSNFNWRGVTLIDPSRKLLANMVASARVTVQTGNTWIDPLAYVSSTVIANSAANIPRYVLTPNNYFATSVGSGFSEPLVGVADTDSFLGLAIQIKNVNLCGFSVKFPVGRFLSTAARVRATVLHKTSGTPAAGNFKLRIAKNGAGIYAVNLTVSASYISQSTTYTLSGFSSGDTYEIQIYNSAVTDQTCNIAAILLEVINSGDIVSSGTFTLSAAVTNVIADVEVGTSSKILLTPTNASAATLMGSSKALYISARTADTSFAVTTANAAPAAGTETFSYVIVY